MKFQKQIGPPTYPDINTGHVQVTLFQYLTNTTSAFNGSKHFTTLRTRLISLLNSLKQGLSKANIPAFVVTKYKSVKKKY